MEQTVITIGDVIEKINHNYSTDFTFSVYDENGGGNLSSIETKNATDSIDESVWVVVGNKKIFDSVRVECHVKSLIDNNIDFNEVKLFIDKLKEIYRDNLNYNATTIFYGISGKISSGNFVYAKYGTEFHATKSQMLKGKYRETYSGIIECKNYTKILVDVPKWEFSYITGALDTNNGKINTVSGIKNVNNKICEFYKEFKNSFMNGVYYELHNESNYLYALLFDIKEHYEDKDKLQYILNLSDIYPETKYHCFAELSKDNVVYTKKYHDKEYKIYYFCSYDYGHTHYYNNPDAPIYFHKDCDCNCDIFETTVQFLHDNSCRGFDYFINKDYTIDAIDNHTTLYPIFTISCEYCGNKNRLDKGYYKFIKFNKCEGDFVCSGLDMKTLQCVPSIVFGTLDCSNNKLESLQGISSIIKGDLILSNNHNLTHEHLNEVDCEVFGKLKAKNTRITK